MAKGNTCMMSCELRCYSDLIHHHFCTNWYCLKRHGMEDQGYDIGRRIELEQEREQLALDVEHATLLGARHRDNERAIDQMSGGRSETLVCVGKNAFIKMCTTSAQDVLRRENERVWNEIESVQRRITKRERKLEIEEAEIGARD